MFAILCGLVLMAFTVFAWMANGLNWSKEIISFLKGASPVIAAFVGLIAIFIGVADIKDKREAKREEEEARRAEEISKN